MAYWEYGLIVYRIPDQSEMTVILNGQTWKHENMNFWGIADTLNELGEQGWEVASGTDKGDLMVWTLKRPVAK